MIKSYKYRIYPTKYQIEMFNKYYDCCKCVVDLGNEKIIAEPNKIDDLDLVIELSFLKMKYNMFTDIFGDPISYETSI